MAIGESYATVPELKSRMDVEDTIDDVRLAEALATASREIEAWCGRQFNKATDATARLFAPDSATLVLVDDFHTTTGLQIAVDSTGRGSFTSWPSTAYRLEPLNGVVSGQPGWPYYRIRPLGGYGAWWWGVDGLVQVTAQWGWEAVPGPVKEACLIMAAESFKLGDAPFGVAGFGEFGPVRVRMNSLAEQKLAPYRRDAILVN